MIEGIFTALYDAMTGSVWLAVLASFVWGILSIILSPCHLSSIPLIVGFISSQDQKSFGRTFNISLVFSVGILITIAVIGFLTASLGRLMGDIGKTGNYLVAGIFFIVGLYLLDIIKLNWNTIGIKETRQKGLLAALILGLLFGLALGPCTFAYMAPVLGVVFETSQTNYFYSISLLSAFGMGHCLVITTAGTLSGYIQNYLNWSYETKALMYTRRICGILVLLGGAYLIFIQY